MVNNEILQQAARILYDRKASDIVALKVEHLTVLCDYLLIASGRSAVQVTSLAEALKDFMYEQGILLRRNEGLRDGRWAVLDYGNLIVHIFHQNERIYYGLDRLWNDGSNEMELPFDQSLQD